MTLAKAVTRTLDVDVDDVRIDLTATIKSYDLTDTKFIFDIQSSQGLTIDLMGGTAMYIVEYVHNSQTYAIQGNIDIINSTKISFNLPEDLKGYKGTVLIGLYVQMADGTKIDIKDIAVRIEPSIMDKGIDFSARTYFEDFETVKAEVTLKGEQAKASINAVVTDVNTYGNSQKQAIDSVVSDVQTTGDTAKTNINAVLPTIQSQVSELDRRIVTLPQIPDLFVAYADDINGGGFSKTDTTKLYKGYGVRNSTNASDYRWERNVGGKNLWINNKTTTTGVKETLPDNHITGQKECWRLENTQLVMFWIEPEFSKRMYGKTFTFSAWIKYENVVQGTNSWNTFNIFKHSVIFKNSSNGNVSGEYYPTLDTRTGTSDWIKVQYTYTHNPSGYDMLKTPLIFNLENAQSGTAWVTGVQVEEGNTATPWSPAQEDITLNSNPINSILTTLSQENPSTTLGGTWVQLGSESKFNNTIYYWKRTQ